VWYLCTYVLKTYVFQWCSFGLRQPVDWSSLHGATESSPPWKPYISYIICWSIIYNVINLKNHAVWFNAIVILVLSNIGLVDRATRQAIDVWLLTAEARVRSPRCKWHRARSSLSPGFHLHVSSGGWILAPLEASLHRNSLTPNVKIKKEVDLSQL
jgi:hypothetical protein